MSLDVAHLLVVDDEQVFRESLAGHLREIGYHVDCAEGAEAALDFMHKSRVDLLLLDLHMPGYNGHALIHALHAEGLCPPIVAMSGTSTRNDLIALIREGVDDFLQKPFAPEAVAAVVERLLGAPPGPSPAHPRPAPSAAASHPQAPSPPPTAGEPSPPASPRARRAAKADPPRRPLRLGQAGRSGGSSSGPLPRRSASSSDRIALPATEEPPALRTREAARGIRDGTIEIPTLAPIASELQRFIKEPTSSLEEVLAVVSRDAVVVASLLRLANSSYFGAASPVQSLRTACSRLGNRRVLSLAQQVVLAPVYGVSAPALRAVVQPMWRNTVVAARGARGLAALVGGVDPDEVQVAVLFHNVGELALVRGLWELDPQAFGAPDFLLRLVPELERLHENMGAAVLQRWGLPRSLVELARAHHRRPMAPRTHADQSVADVVLAAWTGACRAGFAYLPGQAELDAAPVTARLGEDAAWLDGVFADATSWLEEEGEGG